MDQLQHYILVDAIIACASAPSNITQNHIHAQSIWVWLQVKLLQESTNSDTAITVNTVISPLIPWQLYPSLCSPSLPKVSSETLGTLHGHYKERWGCPSPKPGTMLKQIWSWTLCHTSYISGRLLSAAGNQRQDFSPLLVPSVQGQCQPKIMAMWPSLIWAGYKEFFKWLQFPKIDNPECDQAFELLPDNAS